VIFLQGINTILFDWYAWICSTKYQQCVSCVVFPISLSSIGNILSMLRDFFFTFLLFLHTMPDTWKYILCPQRAAYSFRTVRRSVCLSVLRNTFRVRSLIQVVLIRSPNLVRSCIWIMSRSRRTWVMPGQKLCHRVT